MQCALNSLKHKLKSEPEYIIIDKSVNVCDCKSTITINKVYEAVTDFEIKKVELLKFKNSQ